MKYYKDSQNNVYAYELDGSQDYLIAGKVEMTAVEVELHLNPPKTPEQLQAEISYGIQNMLNMKASEFEFDDIKSARAQSAIPLDGTEGAEELTIISTATSLAKWELRCWGTSTRIRNDVAAGVRPMPTVEEVLAEMPVLEI